MIQSINIPEAIEYAKELVFASGNILRQAITSSIECEQKEDQRDLVTKYDLMIESFIIRSLKAKYPEHKFLSEEKINDADLDSFSWIIDPIDGTTNFICFQRNFAVSIALYKFGEPLFGIVYDVVKDDLYIGVSGEGAYLNGERLKRLGQVSLEESILDVSMNSVQIFYHKFGIHFFNLAREIRGHRSLGAASLAICKIAEGELQIYASARLKAWDFAAAAIILQECNGYYGPLDNGKLLLTGEPMAFVACTSKGLYDEISNLFNDNRHRDVLA